MNQPSQKLLDQRRLRDALGGFATGVTVVTALGANGAPAGVTINSFASVSLQPPLILWSLGLNSPSLPAFESCSRYAVNVLAADQIDLAQRFAQSQRDRFDGVELIVGAGGTPMLAGCCAWFECRNEMRYAGGDHLILVGQVEDFQRQEKAPLVFHGGRYRALA